MIYYQIAMQTGYALSASLTSTKTQLVLANSDANDDRQLWGLPFVPNMNGFTMLNKHWNQIAKAESDSEWAPVILVPTNEFEDPLAVWTLGTPFHSVRPVQNSALNLNAQGNQWGPGTDIIIYSWGGGNANEVWSFIPVGDAPPPSAKAKSTAD